MEQNNISKLVPVLIAIATVGGIAFYGGMKYAQGKSAAPQSQQAGFGNNGPRGSRTGTGGAGFNGARTGNGINVVNGEIISKDDKSVTIKLRDGGSQIVFLSGTTEITKSVSGVEGDLVVGQNVSVNGQKNSDGSVTANMVQLRPVFSPSPSVSPAPGK